MSKILFSIIIPIYYRVDCIVFTIQSVLNQTCTNFKVMVVNNGSTDNTEELMEGTLKNTNTGLDSTNDLLLNLQLSFNQWIKHGKCSYPQHQIT